MGLWLVVVPLSPITDPVLQRLQRAVGRVCAVSKPAEASGAGIDREELTADEATRFDDGEPPLGWVEWWRQKANEIQSREGSALITLEPGVLGYHRVEALDPDRLQEHMDTVIWTRPAGVILAWGVPESAMNQRHFRRIPCAGALGVHVDGCAAILVSDSDTVQNWPW